MKKKTLGQLMMDAERTYRVEVHKLYSSDDEYLHVIDGVTDFSEILNALRLLYTDREFQSMYLKVTWSR